MLKIGIIGTGHLGKFHINCIKAIEQFQIVGFYDNNPETRTFIEKEYNIKSYDNVDNLINDSEVIDIVTPTIYHHQYAIKALKQNKHVFIEKPITSTIEEAQDILNLNKTSGTKMQIGFVERFNPAFVDGKVHINNPLFIETHRLAQYNPRGVDVPVVLDLMIHDLDIILNIVKSDIKHIHANGVSVISDTPDIANARIEFNNGCIANVTASRISLKNMRKTRIFQSNAYISMDFLKKETEIISIKDYENTDDPFALVLDLGENKQKKQIVFNKPKSEPINAIKCEFESFAKAIIENKQTEITANDGFKSLSVACQILDIINNNIKNNS